MIGTKYLLTLLILISLILPLQSSILKFAAGEMKTDSQLIIYDYKNSKNPFLTDSENTIIKPKVQVSIEGTPNDDQLKGGERDDKISGEDGNDTIMGGEGNDNIKGGKGDDMLLGGKGDDGILGDEGNDVLNGGEGVDIMAGGLGNDTFICDLFDTIVDFDIEEGDKIIGQCSSLDQTEFERSPNNTPQEDFQSDSPSSPQPPPFPRFNNQIPLEGFQAGPQPPSFHPNNGPPEEFKLPPQTSPPPQPQLQLESPPPPSPPSFYPNNGPPEEFKLPPSPPPQPQPQTQLESPPPMSHDDIPPEDFELFPPSPVHPANEVHLSGT